MKTFVFVVETVRTDKDRSVVTLVRTPQGNVLDVCPLESVGTIISNFIDKDKNEKK